MTKTYRTDPGGFVCDSEWTTAVPIPAGSLVRWNALENRIEVEAPDGKQLLVIQPFDLGRWLAVAK